MANARIGIIGGGIAGLTCAFRLAQAGHKPIVFEAAEAPGGLGSAFVHKGVEIDRFYHVMLDSDIGLLWLIDELGGRDRAVWRETGMGVHTGVALFPLNGGLDLLRFRPLSFADRLRTAAGGLYLTKFKKRAGDLDSVPAASYLRGLFGAQVYTRIWEPLLRAKFGDRAEDVPAYWIWTRLNREKSRGIERKGYLRGGYSWLAGELGRRITALGGEMRLGCAVAALEDSRSTLQIKTGNHTEDFDKVISTLPIPLLKRIAGTMFVDQAWPVPELSYQGVVNVLLIARRSVQPYYWTAVIDPTFPFQGVVETTRVIPTEWTGGRHLIYLMNYCGAESDRFGTADAVLIREAMSGLSTLFPGFQTADIEAAYVFRAPYVEPVWPLGYLHQRPKPRVGNSGLYLCTTAQAYPRVNTWNTGVALAEETVGELLTDVV